MSESEPPQRSRSATIQIDAVDDFELLAYDEAQVSVPPPLPPRGSLPSRAPSVSPSEAPQPRSPLVYVVIAVVGIAAGGLGIYLATTLLADDPPPEAEPATMLEIGDIEISVDPEPSDE